MSPAEAQDPAERFDLVDIDGRPLGRTKARAAVHRDGDWHRSLHLWIALREASGVRVLLQRRGAHKDTHPSRVDVSVAGHLRAGESVDDAFREAEEEVGLRVRREDCARFGTRRSVLRTNALHDRELQEVYLHVTDAPFASLRPDPAEVEAILAVPLPALVALLQQGGTAVAEERGPAGARAVTLDGGALVPHDDGYFLRAARALERWVMGLAPV